MPRPSRSTTHLPGVVSHVIVRFVDGRFLMDDEAREKYLALLASALTRCDWVLLSYALMSSHIHLALLMGTVELRVWAHGLHIRFAQWLNGRLRDTNPRTLGHVIADRPTSLPVCPSRTRFLVGYHHRNPIEAGVSEDAVGSTWTSHRAYLGLDAPRGGLDVARGLELAGFAATADGVREFAAFVERTRVTEEDLRAPEALPVAVSLGATPGATQVVAAAAEVMGASAQELTGPGRERHVVQARRVAIVVGLELGFGTGEMASALCMSRSGASRLLSRAHDALEVQAAAVRVRAKLGVLAA